MRNISLRQNQPQVPIKRISDFILNALLFAIVIVVSGYFFHKGAMIATEIAMNDRFPLPW